MADNKPGKVIRLGPRLHRFIETKRKAKETFDGCLCRLLGLPAKRERERKFEVESSFVLPSDLHATASDARGQAVLKAVKTKRPDVIEKPIEVRRIG